MGKQTGISESERQRLTRVLVQHEEGLALAERMGCTAVAATERRIIARINAKLGR